MNFFNNPEYSSIRIILLIVIIAGAGYFIVNNLSDRGVGEQTGKVLPPIKGQSGGGVIALDPSFTELCADGVPHIKVTAPNTAIDQKITNNLSVTWATCNVPTTDGAPNVTVKLVSDSSRLWAYKEGTPIQPSFAGSTTDDGSQSFALTQLGGFGGFYKVSATVRNAVKVINGQDPGDFDITWVDAATDQSDTWFMIYEDDSYLQATGTKTFTVAGDYYFRTPKLVEAFKSIKKITSGGGGGGGGGSAGNASACSGSGGGAGGSGNVTIMCDATKFPELCSAVVPSDVNKLRVAMGGAGGAGGEKGNLLSSGKDGFSGKSGALSSVDIIANPNIPYDLLKDGIITATTGGAAVLTNGHEGSGGHTSGDSCGGENGGSGGDSSYPGGEGGDGKEGGTGTGTGGIPGASDIAGKGGAGGHGGHETDGSPGAKGQDGGVIFNW